MFTFVSGRRFSAYLLAKADDGAPGIDGVTFAAVDAEDAGEFLDQLREELVGRTYRPQKARKVETPKGGGKMRQLSIPSIRDRVVQGALKLILEPIFEADFQSGSFGYRPKKSAHAAIQRVSKAILEGKTYVIDFDLRSYFDSHPRQQWLRQAVEKRLREELAKLQVEVNEEKSRTVDLQRDESFGFPGFEFRRVRSRRGRRMPLILPKGKMRTALLGKVKEIFRASRSQPVGGVIEKINLILRGWVKYFAIGHSGRCFSYIRDWVEKKIPRHLARACQRRGFGWKRWSREWLYGTLGLFSEYRVSYLPAHSAVAPVGIGLITLDVKCAGARSAGNPHATCDVAGAGNPVHGLVSKALPTETGGSG